MRAGSTRAVAVFRRSGSPERGTTRFSLRSLPQTPGKTAFHSDWSPAGLVCSRARGSTQRPPPPSTWPLNFAQPPLRWIRLPNRSTRARQAPPEAAGPTKSARSIRSGHCHRCRADPSIEPRRHRPGDRSFPQQTPSEDRPGGRTAPWTTPPPVTTPWTGTKPVQKPQRQRPSRHGSTGKASSPPWRWSWGWSWSWSKTPLRPWTGRVPCGPLCEVAPRHSMKNRGMRPSCQPRVHRHAKDGRTGRGVMRTPAGDAPSLSEPRPVQDEEQKGRGPALYLGFTCAQQISLRTADLGTTTFDRMRFTV